MKRSVLIFVLSVLMPLLVVPVLNIFMAPDFDFVNLKEKKFLYNMDFVSKFTSLLLYPLGISSNSKQVVIGKDGWLYLGDMYEKTLSADSSIANEFDISRGRQIGVAVNAWDDYLSSKGVKVFRIMVGPNKGSIYPEYMPQWARPVSPNPTDALFSEAGGNIYIDLRPPLLKAKNLHSEKLYFKTDTHWNSLGSGLAFRYFSKNVGEADPDIKWPSESIYEVESIIPRPGGDLANFLRLSDILSDLNPNLNLTSRSVETTQFDYATGKVISKGGNPQISAPTKLLLVRSEGALNNKKVLWLRDSFGISLAPLMSITFSEVLQIHWQHVMANGSTFAKLVEDWKPDYVFVTVVERAARSVAFTGYPPPPNTLTTK